MPRRVFNLEYDLRNSHEIVCKICEYDVYAQNVYAALCNNDFAPKDVWAILKNLTWNCSWHYASELVASIRREPQLQWYYTGKPEFVSQSTGYVPESVITPEVHSDLDQLGWVVLTTRFID